MSLLRKFLFTDDSPKLFLELEKEESAFGPTYGNRRANGKQFRAPWAHRDRKAAKGSSDAADACNIVGCG